MNSVIKHSVLALALIILLVFNCPAQSVRQKIDTYLSEAVQAGSFSGAVLVAQNGKNLLSKGYGWASLELRAPNTPQTKFRIGSLTKQFTAMAVMILQERGKLQVNDAICKYMPECPQAWSEITIHHLLTHTSGIPDLLSFADFQKTMRLPSSVAQTVERFRNKSLDFKPGEKFNYSNSGFVLLGYIIERVSGESYESFLSENIFTPLGMGNSGSDHSEVILPNRAAGYTRREGEVINAAYIDMSIPTGGGSLYSTVEDLYLWEQSLYTEKLVKKRTLDAIFTAYTTADWGDGTGYGWFIGRDKSNRKVIAHTGGINGFAAHIARFPDEKMVVIVLSNFSFAPVSKIADDLAGLVY